MPSTWKKTQLVFQIRFRRKHKSLIFLEMNSHKRLRHYRFQNPSRQRKRTRGGNGGEGGIRTPDSLATMSDFESGAFNRALPPLRAPSVYPECSAGIKWRQRSGTWLANGPRSYRPG